MMRRNHCQRDQQHCQRLPIVAVATRHSWANPSAAALASTHRRPVRHRRRRPAEPGHYPDDRGQQRRADRREQPHAAAEAAGQRAQPERQLHIPGTHRRRRRGMDQQIHRGQQPGSQRSGRAVPRADRREHDHREPRQSQPIGQPALADVVAGQRRHPEQRRRDQHAGQANPKRRSSPLAAQAVL